MCGIVAVLSRSSSSSRIAQPPSIFDDDPSGGKRNSNKTVSDRSKVIFRIIIKHFFRMNVIGMNVNKRFQSSSYPKSSSSSESSSPLSSSLSSSSKSEPKSLKGSSFSLSSPSPSS